jgi:putative spermidine/putrescine transport system permease protein
MRAQSLALRPTVKTLPRPLLALCIDNWYVAIPVAFLTVFFAFPFLVLFVVSLTKGFPATWQPSFDSYQVIWQKSYYLSFLGTTLLFGAVVTATCAVLGYPIAFFLVKIAKRSYTLLLLAIISPLLVGVVVRTVGWTIMLGTEGIVNATLQYAGVTRAPIQMLYTPGAAVIGMVHVVLPFMVLSTASVLSTLDRSLEEAAYSLGADRARVFWRVTFPLSLPGVAVGCVLVFSLTIGAYLTPVLLGGGKMRLLSPLIYDDVSSIVDWSMASALAVVLLSAGFAVLLFVPLIARLSERR